MKSTELNLIEVVRPFETLEELLAFFNRLDNLGIAFLEKNEVKRTVTYKIPPPAT